MIRKIKRTQDVKIGDWYEGREVVSIKVWPRFAVDIHLDNRAVKLLDYDRSVVVVTPENEVSE